MDKLKKLTEEQLQQKLVEKYGENWLEECDNEDELVKEFMNKISRME